MAMAQRLLLYVVAVLLFALSTARATANPTTQNNGVKYLHFTIYQHDTYNKTSFLIAKGVGGSEITATTSPFGSFFAYRDTYTLTPEPSSQVVGIVEGHSVTTNFNQLSNMVVQTISLRVMNHTGSVIIIGDWDSVKPSNVSIVGGTEDFLFAQGYVKSGLVDVKGYTIIYKADFHLYWPPYAPHVSRQD